MELDTVENGWDAPAVVDNVCTTVMVTRTTAEQTLLFTHGAASLTVAAALFSACTMPTTKWFMLGVRVMVVWVVCSLAPLVTHTIWLPPFHRARGKALFSPRPALVTTFAWMQTCFASLWMSLACAQAPIGRQLAQRRWYAPPLP